MRLRRSVTGSQMLRRSKKKILRQDKELLNLKKVINGFEEFQTFVEKKFLTPQKEMADLNNNIVEIRGRRLWTRMRS